VDSSPEGSPARPAIAESSSVFMRLFRM
jgi:hypothetical protein